MKFSFQILYKLILVTLLLDLSIQAEDIKPSLTTIEYDTTTIDLTTPQPGIVSGRRMEPTSIIQKRNFFFGGTPTAIQPNYNNVFQVFHNQLKQLTVTNLDALKLLMKDLLQLFVFKVPLSVKLAYIYQDITYMIAVAFYSFRYLLDLYLFCLKFKGIIKGHVMFALVLVKFIPSLISTMIRSSLGMRITIG